TSPVQGRRSPTARSGAEPAVARREVIVQVVQALQVVRWSAGRAGRAGAALTCGIAAQVLELGLEQPPGIRWNADRASPAQVDLAFHSRPALRLSEPCAGTMPMA